MMEIPLSSTRYPGLVALIDDEDAELVAGYCWFPVKKARSNTFYTVANTQIDGRRGQVYMHRLIRPDIEGQIDHEDRNGLNNTRANLRPASQSQQNTNQAIRIDNTSGFIGVSQRNNRWHARINVNGKQVHLGYFDTATDAARARDAAAIEHYGEFAALNFPHAMAA